MFLPALIVDLPHLLRLWKPVTEILLFWYGFYLLLMFLRDSGAFQALKGLLMLAIIFFITQFLGLEAISWFLSNLLPLSILAFLIIFQPELRRGLTRIGESSLFRVFLKEERLIDEVVRAVFQLAKRKIGALVAIEKQVGLKPYVESGTPLDSVITGELLTALFTPNAPLHDGGVVIQGGRLVAAACLFPLSQNLKISRSLGTRHRAALGLSEETDALVIVVSEETGTVSVAMGGKLIRDLDEAMLRQHLVELYHPKHAVPKGGLLQWIMNQG